MSYQAPLREMQFVLYELLKGDEILPSLPGYEDATREIMDAMLTEGAKLAQNVIAPTNVPGDREGCVYDPVAKTVKTDRKSTRLNSNHVKTSYAEFCSTKTIRG